jgi:uncharacterized membrane protein AbrB (regulator of aidB expression)
MKEKGIIIIAAILAGAWLGGRLKLPSGYLIGGMIAGLIVKGIVSSNVPSEARFRSSPRFLWRISSFRTPTWRS